MTADVLASLPSIMWPREDMKESPWETERTGVEWALSRRDSRPENTLERETVHKGDTAVSNQEVLMQNEFKERLSDMILSY